MTKTQPLSVRTALHALALAGLASPAWAVHSSWQRTDVGAAIGAPTLYNAGYTGASVIVANAESGHVWSGHEVTGHVTRQFSGGVTDSTSHATSAAHAMAGNGAGTTQRGIAYGAELWSATVASSLGSGGSFYTSGTSLRNGLLGVTRDGASGRTADVVNMSWGSDAESRWMEQAVDATAAQTGAIIVVSAGNRGYSGTGNVGSPASGFNTISVGATRGASSRVPYSDLSIFSSGGWHDYVDPRTGARTRAVRAAVDLVAPGEELRLATTGGSNRYNEWAAGTSFASPLVAGGMALLKDVANRGLGGGEAADSRVLKAVAMNSARKLSGWNNQQYNAGGVITTQYALDAIQGAGAIDLDAAYSQLTRGTTGLGTNGGMIQGIGWDLASVSEGVDVAYTFDGLLQGGSTLTATLTWFVDDIWRALQSSRTSTAAGSLDNLDLQVWSVGNAGIIDDALIAQSINAYDTTEHLSFVVPETGAYELRVLWAGENYDFIGDVNTEDFAIAWSGTLIQPVPASGTIPLAVVVAAGARRRRRGLAKRRRRR